MGADIHEQLIKKRREQPRNVAATCRRCDRSFRSHHEVRSHRAKYHNLHDDSPSPVQSATPPAPAQTPNQDAWRPAGQRSPPPPPLFRQNSAIPSSSSTPPAALGSNPHVGLQNLKADFETRDSSVPRRRTPVPDVTSSLLPLVPEGQPSRTQTPQLPGSGDATAHMHISRLSLDENQPQYPSGSALALRKIDTSPLSKKRPASAEAHDPRSSMPRPSQKASARHKGDRQQHQAPVPSQNPVAHEFQKPRAPGGKTHDPKALERSRHGLNQPPPKSEFVDDNFGNQLAMHSIAVGNPTPTHEMPGKIQAQLKQASSNIISRDQLSAEVKGLYRSLEIVEKRCIMLDQAQMSEQGKQNKPEPKHWQALSALHRTLLYEHHDFLLASQHPSASSELKMLASERQIPFRMWKYAIHAYLELLRQHLPESLEFMESFIYLSYQMMALLYETVPLFEDVWTECLGDLARYRMAIENNSSSVRSVWSEVARWWYSRASDRQPLVGRLYHHLGILARPDLSRQLFYYCKSLCCVQPFPNARHSLKAVFEASLAPQPTKSNDAISAVDHLFVRTHKVIYDMTLLDQARSATTEFANRLDATMPDMDKKWKDYGIFLAVSNLAACFGYGAAEDPLRVAIERTERKVPSSTTAVRTEAWNDIAVSMLASTMQVLLRRDDDKRVLPHIHVVMVLLQILCTVSAHCVEASSLLTKMPWDLITRRLNALASSKENMPDRIRKSNARQHFIPKGNEDTPLMEDFAMRGLVWCKDFFPENWFDGKDKDELPHQETAKFECSRSQRILWSAVKISMASSFLHFDRNACQFSVGYAGNVIMRTDD